MRAHAHATCPHTPYPCTRNGVLPTALPCVPSADRSRSLNRAVGDCNAAEGHPDCSLLVSFHLHRARLQSGTRMRLGQLHARSRTGPILISDAARDETSCRIWCNFRLQRLKLVQSLCIPSVKCTPNHQTAARFIRAHQHPLSFIWHSFRSTIPHSQSIRTMPTPQISSRMPTPAPHATRTAPTFTTEFSCPHCGLQYAS